MGAAGYDAEERGGVAFEGDGVVGADDGVGFAVLGVDDFEGVVVDGVLD